MNRPDKVSAWLTRKNDVTRLLESVQIKIKSHVQMDVLWVYVQHFPMDHQKYMLSFRMSFSTSNESMMDRENENSTEFLEFLLSWLREAIPPAEQMVLIEDSSESIPEPLRELQTAYDQDGQYDRTQLQCRNTLHVQFGGSIPIINWICRTRIPWLLLDNQIAFFGPTISSPAIWKGGGFVHPILLRTLKSNTVTFYELSRKSTGSFWKLIFVVELELVTFSLAILIYNELCYWLPLLFCSWRMIRLYNAWGKFLKKIENKQKLLWWKRTIVSMDK